MVILLGLGLGLELRFKLGFGLGLAFLKYLCDNYEHQKLALDGKFQVLADKHC